MEVIKTVTREVPVRAVRFPDDGPGQHEVADWIKERTDNNYRLGLYDRATESKVKTCTKANWRWRYAFLESDKPSVVVNIWDYIVLYFDGTMKVYRGHEFLKFFTEPK